MKTLILRGSLVLAVVIATCSAAFAQYVWVDENGSKQFSDQPPPASVPKNKILKAPGRSVESVNPESTGETDQAKNTKPPESIAEKEAAYKKRHEEMAAKEKKAADEAKNTAAKADNCKRMREYKQALDSGVRIAQSDANGNRSYMADDKRAQEMSSVNQNLGDCAN